ncbi:hypothetical protein BJ944DRAFT_241020 [Cunninghamella echinulata]|nr:hypothetical protein BJ944DRAFT_241020 [Cunninghamella echinulata]
MTHLQNGNEYQLFEKYNEKKELYPMNSNKIPTQQHKNNSKLKDTPVMIESRYDISTLRAISETMLARHHNKKRSLSSRELHYHNKKKNRSTQNDMEKIKYMMDSSTSSSFSSLIPLKSPCLPQVIRRFTATATATSLRSISPSHSPTQTNGTRHSTSSVQPRWHNQACMLFLALRDHPQHEMPRTELINAALELDKNISKEKKLPHAFRGKTPKNSASAILTNNHGKHFQAFRPDGSRSMHFRLTFKPANFMKASKLYREWLEILYKHDWPLCFGKPQKDTNENNDSKSLNSPPTPHPTTTTVAQSSPSSSSPNEKNNTSLTTKASLPLIPSINEKNTKSTDTIIPSCGSTSSTAIDDISLLPTPPISNSPSFDQDFSDNKNQAKIVPEEGEDQDEDNVSFRSHPTEFDYFMALRQQERERLTMNSADEYNKENQIVDQSMLPSPTHHYPFNNGYNIHDEFNQNKKNVEEVKDNDLQQQQQLNGSNISICDTISWKIVGDSYYLKSSDTPIIPTSWRDIVRVEHKYTTKGDTYYTVYANRRLPCNIPIGFYFGVPVSEEEFDLFKEDNGQALSTSVMYGKTILDPTDDYGQLFTDPNQEQTKVYCPFNFIREADTPEHSNISLLKGRIQNQVICWTQREIAKDEELLTWLEYNHI